MTIATAPRPPAAPPGRNGPASRPVKTFGRSRGIVQAAQGIVLYGTGGIGKTELASLADRPLFADIENGSKHMNVERIDGLETWADLRGFVQSGDFSGVGTFIVDSATKAEEWAYAHIVANVPHEKGHKVERIEDYGFGKGYVHAYEEWRRFLGDLEGLKRKGVNVILIAHEQVAMIPNPTGDDFKRYQPRLQSAEKSNILAATKEWSDHVLFVSYDSVVKDGKAKGEGSRTIYCTETPSRMAKTRTLSGEPMVYQRGDGSVWKMLTGTPANDTPPV